MQKDILEDLSFSSDEIDEIDKTTRRQCQCQEWFDSKIGFITASKAKNVYTRQQSYEANSTEDISRIVETIVKHTSHQSIRNNTDGEPTNPMKCGLRHEENARDGYLRTEGRKHNKIQLSTKGFVISKQKPFLGASPDNIRSCKCKRSCQNVLVESICVTLETFWVTHVIPRMMKNVQAEVNPVELLGNF